MAMCAVPLLYHLKSTALKVKIYTQSDETVISQQTYLTTYMRNRIEHIHIVQISFISSFPSSYIDTVPEQITAMDRLRE